MGSSLNLSRLTAGAASESDIVSSDSQNLGELSRWARRAGEKSASLGRYKPPIAKNQRLLDLKDPTMASLFKLGLQAILQRPGTVKKQGKR